VNPSFRKLISAHASARGFVYSKIQRVSRSNGVRLQPLAPRTPDGAPRGAVTFARRRQSFQYGADPAPAGRENITEAN
jgi:hypothetical protein